jgi:predicted permease
VLASVAGRVLVSLISTGPSTLPIAFELDLRVLAFTIAVSLLTGVLFSLAPALRAGRVDLIASLKEGKASMSSPRKVTLGRAMVVGQVALSLVLLVGAGLLLRSFQNLTAAGTGFDRNNVLLFKIDSASSGYKQDARLGDLYSRIAERTSHMPGVSSAAVALYSFHEGGWGETFEVPGTNLSEKERKVSLNFITPGYFNTFQVKLLAGRLFSSQDGPNAPLSAVIGERFARRIFGSLDVVGKTFLMSPLTPKDVPFQVIGVVSDVKREDVRDEFENSAWLSLAQCPVYAGNIAVRVAGDPATVAAQVRSVLQDIEPNLPIRWTTTLADEVGDSLVRERAIAQLSTFFATLALLLSAIGLYGTISFAVARRTGEIGIRMALGANGKGVLALVMKDAMSLVSIGAAIGLPLSFAAGKALQSLLFGLSPFDAISAIAATLGLAVVAAIAGYLPARRAANLDPVIALRTE